MGQSQRKQQQQRFKVDLDEPINFHWCYCPREDRIGLYVYDSLSNLTVKSSKFSRFLSDTKHKKYSVCRIRVFPEAGFYRPLFLPDVCHNLVELDVSRLHQSCFARRLFKPLNVPNAALYTLAILISLDPSVFALITDKLNTLTFLVSTPSEAFSLLVHVFRQCKQSSSVFRLFFR